MYTKAQLTNKNNWQHLAKSILSTSRKQSLANSLRGWTLEAKAANARSRAVARAKVEITEQRKKMKVPRKQVEPGRKDL